MLLRECSLSFHTPALPCTQSQALSLPWSLGLGREIRPRALSLRVGAGRWAEPATLDSAPGQMLAQPAGAGLCSCCSRQWNDLTPTPSSAETLPGSAPTSV